MSEIRKQRPVIPGVSDYSVCRDCQQRQVGCHSACRAYLAFASENEARRAEARKRAEREGDIVHVRFRKALRKKPDSGR